MDPVNWWEIGIAFLGVLGGIIAFQMLIDDNDINGPF